MKVSVIVPIYNTEAYLEKCIDSVLAQTLEDFELILIDDGSTDRSAEICDAYAKQDTRIIVIHKKNEGLTKARQSGIAIAKGEYVGFLDSDDWYDSEFLETHYIAAAENNADVVCSGIKRVFANGTVITYPETLPAGKYEAERLQLEFYPHFFYSGILPGVMPSTCTKLFRNSLIHETSTKVDERIFSCEDYSFSYPSLLHADTIVMLSDVCLYNYLERKDSGDHSYQKDLILQLTLLDEILKKEVDRIDNKQLTCAFNLMLCNNCLRVFNNECVLNNDIPFKTQCATISEMVEKESWHHAVVNSQIASRRFRDRLILSGIRNEWKVYLYLFLFANRMVRSIKRGLQAS